MEAALPRDSHVSFFEARDWTRIRRFYQDILTFHRGETKPNDVLHKQELDERMNHIIVGDDEFGVTNLRVLYDAGFTEFNNPKSLKYKRRTFAIRLGYLGTEYLGYQRQKDNRSPDTWVKSVEQVIFDTLGCTTVSAGRTDTNVSAVSQIISFCTWDESVTPAKLLQKLQECTDCRVDHSLFPYECFQVPRKFHSRFSATWRRYIYIFPTNSGSYEPGGIDIDIPFINEVYQSIEGKTLPCAFAFRNKEDADGDTTCTFYRARASYVESSDCYSSNGKYCCVELVANRFRRRQVRIMLATAIRESLLPAEQRNINLFHDISTQNDCSLCSYALPGVGLIMAGVGYDVNSLHSTPPLNRVEHAPIKPVKRVERSSDLWKQYRHELSTCDGTKLYYPQRCFEFPDFSLVVDNNIAAVGSLIWDAEVLLAKYVNALITDETRGVTVNTLLELGGGVGLAAMVAFKKGLKQVYIQEVEDVAVHTRSNLMKNNCDNTTVISALWGAALVDECAKLSMLSKFDVIIMADVLYHEEHMPALVESILRCMAASCKIVICCEQRRKDLNTLFFDDLFTRINTYTTESAQYFVVKWMVYRYAIEQGNEDIPSDLDTEVKPVIQFYLHVIDVTSRAHEKEE